MTYTLASLSDLPGLAARLPAADTAAAEGARARQNSLT